MKNPMRSLGPVYLLRPRVVDMIELCHQLLRLVDPIEGEVYDLELGSMGPKHKGSRATKPYWLWR